ncbi:MAG: DNA primase [Candidatus Pacebacteria bacterium]|nr:DNA primase [Candidatus Paceibacterota bacterium]
MDQKSSDIVKEKLDIVEFIKQYITLTPAGRNFKGNCPFHKEKTPSFMVNVDRQIFKCFGCGAGGDVFGFLMKHDNLEFIEALKILAEKAGVDLKLSGSKDEREYNILYEIVESARDFFKNNLFSESLVAETARNYLKERGLKKETVLEFEIGLASNSSDALSKFLLSKGFRMPDIERAGLVFKTDRGTYWDRFRDRVMFPIWNNSGKVVGFTGRIMPGSPEAETSGKYINSPETQIFNKSKILYGFNKSKNIIRELDLAVLVEGQMDLIMLYQDGLKNTFASSGTSLTREQLDLLKKTTQNIIIFYDDDEAGRIATERANEMASMEDFSVKIFNVGMLGDFGLIGFKDAADIVFTRPGFLYKELFKIALPAMHFYIKSILGSFGEFKAKDSFQRKADLKKILNKLKIIKSPIEQSFWIKEVADLVGASEKDVQDELKPIKLPSQFNKQSEESPIDDIFFKKFNSRKDTLSKNAIAIALNGPDLWKEILENTLYFPDFYKDVIKNINGNLDSSDEVKKMSDYLRFYSGGDIFQGDLKVIFLKMLKELKLDILKDDIADTKRKIKEAEKSRDEALLRGLLKKFDDLNKEMYS